MKNCLAVMAEVLHTCHSCTEVQNLIICCFIQPWIISKSCIAVDIARMAGKWFIVVVIARTALNMVNMVVAIARTALKMVTIFVEIARMALNMVTTVADVTIVVDKARMAVNMVQIVTCSDQC